MTPFFAQAANALLASLWQTAMLVALVALALRAAPRISAAGRHLVWAVVFALLTALSAVALLHPAHLSAAVAAPAGFSIDLRWGFVALAAWAALSLFRLGQFVASSLHLRHIQRTAVALPWDPALSSTLWISRLRGSARLCASSEVNRPCVLGFIHPRILLPAPLLATLSPAEIEHILLHEVQHLRRWDDWINASQKLALVLFPLNPALFWVERRLCFERELACDEGVLRATRDTKSYARCLLTIAERTLPRGMTSLVLGAWERRSQLSRRIQSMLRFPAQPNSRRTRWSAAGLSAAALLATFSLARTPQFAAFTAPATHTEVSRRATHTLGVAAPTPQFQDVVFHPGDPATRPRVISTIAHPVKPVTPATRTHQKIARRRAPTSTASVESRPVRPSSFFITVSQSTCFAALPTARGWLLIQL